ncbi:hypothetical protein ACFYYB_29755 [Streptomyces sp. NPDC002886]
MSTSLKAAAVAAVVLIAVVVWLVLDKPWTSEPESDVKLPRPSATASQ